MSYSHSSTVPIEMLPGIGHRTAKVLRSMHIRTVGQFKALPLKLLMEVFGPSIRALYTEVHGIQTARIIKPKAKVSRLTRPSVRPALETKPLGFVQKFRLATQVLMM